MNRKADELTAQLKKVDEAHKKFMSARGEYNDVLRPLGRDRGVQLPGDFSYSENRKKLKTAMDKERKAEKEFYEALEELIKLHGKN